MQPSSTGVVAQQPDRNPSGDDAWPWAGFAKTARNETYLDALTAELVGATQETRQPEGVNV